MPPGNEDIRITGELEDAARAVVFLRQALLGSQSTKSTELPPTQSTEPSLPEGLQTALDGDHPSPKPEQPPPDDDPGPYSGDGARSENMNAAYKELMRQMQLDMERREKKKKEEEEQRKKREKPSGNVGYRPAAPDGADGPRLPDDFPISSDLVLRDPVLAMSILIAWRKNWRGSRGGAPHPGAPGWTPPRGNDPNWTF